MLSKTESTESPPPSTFPFEEGSCAGTVRIRHPDVIVDVTFKELVDQGKVQWLAAAPADHRASYAGSGLPFPNPSAAFYGTPNKGVLTVDPVMGTGSEPIRLKMPNSYYVCVGSHLIPPRLYLLYQHRGEKRKISITLSTGIPYRSLSYPPARPLTGAMFYAGGWEMPVRTQEQILRDAAYPKQNVVGIRNATPALHWGLKPPL